MKLHITPGFPLGALEYNIYVTEDLGAANHCAECYRTVTTNVSEKTPRIMILIVSHSGSGCLLFILAESLGSRLLLAWEEV